MVEKYFLCPRPQKKNHILLDTVEVYQKSLL